MATWLHALCIGAARCIYSKDFIFGLGWCAELKLSLKSHLLLNRRSTTFEIKRSGELGLELLTERVFSLCTNFHTAGSNFFPLEQLWILLRANLNALQILLEIAWLRPHQSDGYTQTLLHFLLS